MIFRPLILRFGFYLGLAVLGFGLFRVQVVEGHRYRKLSEQNRVRIIPLEAPRGRVFDHQGNLLATNRPSYNVVAMPEDATPEVFTILAKLLNLDEKEIRKRMSAPREYPFAPALIQEDISRELMFKIEEHRNELPGVDISISFRRYYPYNETASHLIGYIGKINRKEYKKSDRRRFGMNSWIGRTGIEKIYDDKLRGWRGGKHIEVNARGKLVRVLSETAAEPGEDLIVTLDLEFQKKLMELVKGKNASIAVMDLKTEGITALVSSPAFDPNVFVTPGRGKERLGFLRDKKAPLLDRGTGSSYPPGSVFKLVTALAALETGKITPSTRFYCPGYFRLNSKSRKFRCWHKQGHGSVNLYEAIERSCNVYFYQLGAKLSADDIAKYARELGLGESMKIELSHVAAGLVPDSAWKKKRYRERWYKGETLSFAIGQGFLLVSPLQVLRLTGTIAKNGLEVAPRIIKVHKGDDQKVRERVAIHEANLKIIKRGMLKVVNSDFGTGQLARVDFTKLAGKTGTAQAPPNKSHSWMTGFFPYKDPEVAFVVFVEHGGAGGVTGANLAKDMMRLWREHVAQVG